MPVVCFRQVTFDACGVYIEVHVCVIDKRLCEYDPNQATHFGVNPGLILSKTSVNKDCFNMPVYGG